MMECLVRNTPRGMHGHGQGGVASGFGLVHGLQSMDMDQCAQYLPHRFMNSFDDAVTLGAACHHRHRLDPSSTQQILKCRTHKFQPLVMYDTYRAWVMRQPAIFKGSSTLSRGLCYNGFDF